MTFGEPRPHVSPIPRRLLSWVALLVGLTAGPAQAQDVPHARRKATPKHPTPRPKARPAPDTSPTPKTKRLKAAPLPKVTFKVCRKRLQSWTSMLAMDRKGEALYKGKKFALAAAQYEKVYALLKRRASAGKTPKTRACAVLYARSYVSRLAITYHWRKRFLRAHRLYRLCATSSPKARQRKACQRQQTRIQRRLVRLEIDLLPSDGTLLLRHRKSQPRRYPSTMKQWFLPGRFVLQMSKKGYITEQVKLKLAAGTKFRQSFRLRRPPCPSSMQQIGGAGGVLFLGPSVTSSASTAATLSTPLSSDQKELHTDPLEQHPGMSPTQIALLVSGVTAGAALLGLGVYGIYRLNVRTYSWTPPTTP